MFSDTLDHAFTNEFFSVRTAYNPVIRNSIGNVNLKMGRHLHRGDSNDHVFLFFPMKVFLTFQLTTNQPKQINKHGSAEELKIMMKGRIRSIYVLPLFKSRSQKELNLRLGIGEV